MKWDEFRDLVAGLNDKTPLGYIVSIRAENDKDVLKEFSKHEHDIRRKWRTKVAKKTTQEKQDEVLEAIKTALISLAGDNNKKEG